MESRHRKTLYRQDWRSKVQNNMAIHRYQRDFILKLYQNMDLPRFGCEEKISQVLLALPSPPLLNEFFPFTQPFQDEPNSRKYLARERKAEQIPEWYHDDQAKVIYQPPKIDTPKNDIIEEDPSEKLIKNNQVTSNDLKIIKNPEKNHRENIEKFQDLDLEDRFSKIDMQVEEKLKKIPEHEEEDIPEWDQPTNDDFEFSIPVKSLTGSASRSHFLCPIYDGNLLKYQVAIGNPFAQFLLKFLIPLDEQAVTFAEGSRAFEKIWCYKDLEERVHGPFSSLEMFSWTIRNCFPTDLQIALASQMSFMPMYIFNSLSKDPDFYPSLSERSEKFHPSFKKDIKRSSNTENSATLHLKDLLGINKRGK